MCLFYFAFLAPGGNAQSWHPIRFRFLPSNVGDTPYLTEKLGLFKGRKARHGHHRQPRPGAVCAHDAALGTHAPPHPPFPVPRPPSPKGCLPQRPASPASSFAHLLLPVAPTATRGFCGRRTRVTQRSAGSERRQPETPRGGGAAPGAGAGLRPSGLALLRRSALGLALPAGLPRGLWSRPVGAKPE